MGGNANVSVAKQSAQEVGQCGSFSDEQWYAKSTGKRRRLAGADHGQSCTGSVLPGNGGFDVPNNSTLAERGIGHAERQYVGGRDGTSVHQRLGDRGGGKGAMVRSRIGVNRIPGGDDQSQSLIRRMPSMSGDADEFPYNPCATSDMLNPSESPKTGTAQIAEEADARHIADASIAPNVVPVLKKLKVVDEGLNVPEELAAGKAGGNAKTNGRMRRAKKLKKRSASLLAAAKCAERSAQLSSALAPVPMPFHEVGVDEQDATARTQILRGVKSAARKKLPVGGSVTTFRQTTHVPEGGSCDPPLRIIQREVLAAAVRQAALLAMVKARAEFSRKNSPANKSPNSQIRPPNRGDGPTQDE
jgi:hypothetical protein